MYPGSLDRLRVGKAHAEAGATDGILEDLVAQTSVWTFRTNSAYLFSPRYRNTHGRSIDHQPEKAGILE